MWCVQRRACPRPLHLNLSPRPDSANQLPVLSYCQGEKLDNVTYLIADQTTNNVLLQFTPENLEHSTFLDFPNVPSYLSIQHFIRSVNTRHESHNSSDEPPESDSAIFLCAECFRVKAEEDVRHEVENALIRKLRHQMHSIRNLLSVRLETQRVIPMSSAPFDDYVGQNGEYTLLQLQRIVDQHDGTYDFMKPYLYSVANISGVID